VGNNNNEIMLNGGSSMAGPIWVRAMQRLSANLPNEQFPVPAGVVQRAVCFSNGGLANTAGTGTYNEYFLGSALPKETCTVKDRAQEEAEKKKQEEADKAAEEAAKKAAEKAAKEAEKQTEEDAADADPSTDTNTGTGTGTDGSGGTGTTAPTTPTSPQTTPQSGRTPTTTDQ
jgi:membrane carboxypeptidase/penicillin-binding protein